jgi:molybdopterin synthase catalytic subunit
MKNAFVEGPIKPEFIAESIAKHAAKFNIGAHSIFLGQVRADVHESQTVSVIIYEAYLEMANEKMHEIRESAFEKYDLICMHIYHSLGEVKSGEISLFVFVSSIHRAACISACNEIVERIKKEVPVWGKEVLNNGEIIWKTNTP